MPDPLEDIIGDYRGFAAQQRDRLAERGIDVSPYGLSHLAYRAAECDEYVRVRGLIERHAVANSENVRNQGARQCLEVGCGVSVVDR